MSSTIHKAPVMSVDAAKKNAFAFSKDFKREFDCAMKLYDEMFSEFHKVTSSTTVDIPDEYGVCNNNYKLRYITPTNISTFISYVMKASKNDLLMPNIGDMEKFSVASAKQFLEENGCVPIENSSIYGLYQYTSDQMTLQEMIILCENDVYHTSVCSKYDMTQRKASMKNDVNRITNLHFGANMKKIVSALPELMNKTDYIEMDYPVRTLIASYVESFILFAITLNCVTMSNMILYCVPKSTYNKKLMSSPKLEVKYNSLMEESDEVEHAYTECCLLKTNGIMLSNKIPFNINMRDIVLQDMHPHFKDTTSALHFILKDKRSPISQLVLKYAKEDNIMYMNIDAVVNLFAHDVRFHCKCDEDFFSQYDRVDFHTDVNWLDKIAYGNNYLNGNYRKDGVGNHHFNPMTDTLDVLYRMFGDCALRSSEELANHILVVSELMQNIICMYKDARTQNWDLTRDALAVLGEILTRCMIKLYNNHMTVFVAKDNMDNVDAPGYLYTESFIMEADEKPKVEVDTGDGVKGAIKKAVLVASQILHKFIAWINGVLAKSPIKFFNTHKAEKDWIDKNAKLNEEIGNALGTTFNPSITNFPGYKIPADKIQAVKISDVIDPYINDPSKEINELEIKKAFYPDPIKNKLTQENSTPNKDSKNKQSPEQTWLSNFFLYGDPDHQPTGNQSAPLKKEQWKELYTDLSSSFELLNKTVTRMAEDLNDAATTLERKAKEAENASSSTSGENGANNDKSENAKKAENRYDTLSKILRSVAEAYHVTFINCIQTKFYPTCYTLYRDIITVYNQQKGKQTQNATQQTESFVDAIDGLRDVII